MKNFLAILFLLAFATSCFAFVENTDNFELKSIDYRPSGRLGEIEYFGEITNNSGEDYFSIEFEVYVEFQGDVNFDKFRFEISPFKNGTTKAFNQCSSNLRLYNDNNFHELKYTIKSAYSHNL